MSVRYVYRQYPVNKDCNAALPANVPPEAVNANACSAARAAEAAGRLGGNDAYWRMYAWLLSNQSNFTPASVNAAAAMFGLDGAKFKAAMDAPESLAPITNDVDAARAVSLRSVPTVFVAGRKVPRPKLEGADILSTILKQAAAESVSDPATRSSPAR